MTAFVDTGGFATISSRTLLGDLIELAHGKSVAGASPEQGPFPVKRLRRSSTPTSTSPRPGARGRCSSCAPGPECRRLQAVRSGRFAVLPEDATIAGPQVGEALEQVARILHPR